MNRRAVFGICGALALEACSSAAGTRSLPSDQLTIRSHQTYSIHILGSLGGTNSAANTINDLGWAMGVSSLSGNATIHATIWKGHAAIDLKTLGGPNSAIEWPVLNDDGYASGISETSTKDPLGESKSWSCHAFLPDGGSAGDTCVGFVWHNGTMKPLPTAGGNNGYAAGMNQTGTIAGWAETSQKDSTCIAPQQLQFVPVTWDASTQTVHQLPTLTVNGKTDPDGAATAVNRSGEVVGISGICDQAVGRFTAIHAVAWIDGVVTKLKTIGGTSWNTPSAINDRGQIVGFLNQPGKADKQGSPNFTSAIWNDASAAPTVIQPLPGDALSEPTSINNHGVVIGVSFPSSHVWLWKNRKTTDLTKLVATSFPKWQLVSVGGINDDGTIAGQACKLVSGGCPASGAMLATFRATPENQ
ncbi:MAG TPA: hypothetical protein VFE36_14085 [Candidatus Baltobacteraceae bacterium]|nr:hypothetical protein [Candidatus Baltobacteraceae bacterium]